MARVISAMTDEQRAELAARTPVLKLGGGMFTAHNQCMIAVQFPSATVCAGYRDWRAAGRAVRKGEHGQAIFVPAGGDKRIDPETGEEQTAGATFFIIGTVFDISQTDPIQANRESPRAGIVDAPEQTELALVA